MSEVLLPPSLGAFVIAQIKQLDNSLAEIRAGRDSLPERASVMRDNLKSQIEQLEAQIANLDNEVAAESERLDALEQGANMAKDAFGIALNNLPPEILTPEQAGLTLVLPDDVGSPLDRPITLN